MPDTTILGYVSIVPKGAYSPTTTYNRLNVVSYNGASFMLIVDAPTTGVTPVDGATWLQLCAAGEGTTVSAQDVAYASSDQGETPPDTGWQTTVPTVPGGGYLWTRIKTTYSDGSSYDTFMVTRFGLDGSGSVSSVNGISPDGTGNVTLTIGSIAQVDSVPTFNSKNLVTSGGVYSRINAVLSSTQVKIQNDVVSLPAASWTGSGPYTQTVAVAGTTAQSQINVAGSPAQIAAAQNGGYNIQFVNGSRTITAYAIGAKPSTDLSVFVTITELSGATGTIYGAPLVGSPVFPSGILKGNGSGVVSAVSTIPVASGGTGAKTAAAARANLGALSSADGAVETAKIKDKAVTAPKIADGAISVVKQIQLPTTGWIKNSNDVYEADVTVSGLKTTDTVVLGLRRGTVNPDGWTMTLAAFDSDQETFSKILAGRITAANTLHLYAREAITNAIYLNCWVVSK